MYSSHIANWYPSILCFSFTLYLIKQFVFNFISEVYIDCQRTSHESHKSVKTESLSEAFHCMISDKKDQRINCSYFLFISTEFAWISKPCGSILTLTGESLTQIVGFILSSKKMDYIESQRGLILIVTHQKRCSPSLSLCR